PDGGAAQEPRFDQHQQEEDRGTCVAHGHGAEEAGTRLNPVRERRIRPHATITASALIIGIAAVRLATVAGGPADGWPSYGHDPARRANEPCRRRIYEAPLDARLIALDARTGTPCADFGRGGHVDLTGVAAYRKGEYHMTSPPAVVDDVVIVGSAIDDNGRV